MRIKSSSAYIEKKLNSLEEQINTLREYPNISGEQALEEKLKTVEEMLSDNYLACKLLTFNFFMSQSGKLVTAINAARNVLR
jgi:hypothetical protein